MQSMSNAKERDIRVRFGKTVREFRLKKGLSQEELAGLSRLHRTYISDIEGGGRNVSLVNVEKLALALKIPIRNLF